MRKSVKEEIGPGKFFCRKCNSDDIEYYETDDYEDYHYFCMNESCKHDWWVEGSDG